MRDSDYWREECRDYSEERPDWEDDSPPEEPSSAQADANGLAAGPADGSAFDDLPF
jgi:hypothetical protein